MVFLHARALAFPETFYRLQDQYQVRSFITGKMINHFWTPEQIAGYLKYKQKTLPNVSHETIYS